MDNENLNSACQDDSHKDDAPEPFVSSHVYEAQVESDDRSDLAVFPTSDESEPEEIEEEIDLFDSGSTVHSTAYDQQPVETSPDVRKMAVNNVRGIQILQRVTSSRLNQIRFGQAFNYENSVHTLLAVQLLQEDLAREIMQG